MKSWIEDIRQHVTTWSGRLREREWWPRFVYHYTDVQNAVNILKEGSLYSRAEAARRGLMVIDNADQTVIAKTRPAHLRFVRLYFRPRTPTQFRNEGIRPPDHRWHGSHCPVPVFFCFDAVNVLGRDDTEFSDGNMASSSVRHAGTQEFFRQIPFQYVYHQGAFFSPDERDTIVFHRHAEVLVPTALPLEPALTMIACRSVAERQTLLHLLPLPLRLRWLDRVRLGYEGLFERRWTYVESVAAISQQAIFNFNPNTEYPGSYQMRFVYREAGTRKDRAWEGRGDMLNQPFVLEMPQAVRGELRLYLDDCLAFAGNVSFEDIPF